MIKKPNVMDCLQIMNKGNGKKLKPSFLHNSVTFDWHVRL